MRKHYNLDDITVTIPTLNEEKNISQCIKSIRKAGIKKIIVIDGCSDDKTVQKLKNLKVKFIKLPNKKVLPIKECLSKKN